MNQYKCVVFEESDVSDKVKKKIKEGDALFVSDFCKKSDMDEVDIVMLKYNGKSPEDKMPYSYEVSKKNKPRKKQELTVEYLNKLLSSKSTVFENEVYFNTTNNIYFDKYLGDIKREIVAAHNEAVKTNRKNIKGNYIDVDLAYPQQKYFGFDEYDRYSDFNCEKIVKKIKEIVESYGFRMHEYSTNEGYCIGDVSHLSLDWRIK